MDGQPVCDDTFTESSHGEVNAQVICRCGTQSQDQIKTMITMAEFFRMLGYGEGTFTRESQFGNAPGGNFGMDDVKCSGSETDFRDCSHVTYDDCGAGEAAGVICSNYLGSDAESPAAPLGE